MIPRFLNEILKKMMWTLWMFKLQRCCLSSQKRIYLQMQETWVRSLGWEEPLEKGIVTHSRIFAWELYGQRSLVGSSPWGRKESDMTERLTHTQGVFLKSHLFLFIYIWLHQVFAVAQDLGWVMQELSLQCTDFPVVACRLSCSEACGILVLWPGIKPISPVLWKYR